MADKERKVFTFEPGNGFTQVDEAPVVSKEDRPTETVNTDSPTPDREEAPRREDLPRPEKNTSGGESNSGIENNSQGGNDENEDGLEDTTARTIDGEEVDSSQEQENEGIEGDYSDDNQEADDNQESDQILGEDKNEGQPESGSEEEVPETDDFFVAASTRLKATGVLPEDFELEEGLSEEEADQRIYEAYVENLKPDANKELLSEFQNEIKKRGWTEDTLKYASMLQNGVRPDEIARIQDYKTLASVEPKKMSDDDKYDYVRQMYEDRGWKDKEIKRVIDAADIDGEIDNLVTEASGYFDSRNKQHEKQQMEIAKRNQQQQEKIAKYKQSVISSIFDKKELAGEKFTEEQLDILEESLYNRNIPVQHDGQIYNLTPYEQFENALQQDFGLKIWAFKKWLFKDEEVEAYKEEAMREAENNQVVKWGRKTKKVKSQDDNKDNKTKSTNRPKTSASKTGGDSYVFEGGEFKKVGSR